MPKAKVRRPRISKDLAPKPRNTKSEIDQLRARLEEAEETLSAIRSGEVDAIAVDGPKGRQVFTLQSADQPYRILAEGMSEGAASMTADGTIVFCNDRLADMVGRPPEKLLGTPIFSLVAEIDRANFRQMLSRGLATAARGETQLVREDGTLVPVLASLKMIPGDPAPGLCMVATDLSEFKCAESEKQKAQEEARRLAAIVEFSDDAIVSKTRDGVITSWNRGAEHLYGYTAAEAIGQPVTLIVPPELHTEVRRLMHSVCHGQTVEHYETVRLRKDGRRLYVSVTLSPVKNSLGEIIGTSGIVHDLTARRQAEEKLREASRYTRSLIEASMDPLVTISREGKITDVNEATEKVTGVVREHLIGSDFSNYFTEPEKARCGYEEVFAKGFVHDYPLAIRHTSGSITDVLYNAGVFKNQRGEISGVFAAARDVTARNRAEAKVKDASLYARSLIEASLDPLVTISREGKITDVNEATVKVTGKQRAKLIGTDFSNYFTEPDKAREGYRQVFEKGFVTDYPLTIRDGKLVEVLYNASVYRDAAGNVAGVFAAARDVTESNRVTREFAETRNFLANILQSSTKYSIIGKDLNQTILSWNRGAQLNYGYAEEEIVGKNSNLLHVPEDIKSGAVDKLLATALEKGLAEGEFERVRKDGTRFMASVVITRRNDPSGQPIGYLLMSTDITEKREAQEKLQEASRYTRSLIEASLDPLVTISKLGKITDVNQATEIATGCSRDRLIGSDFCDYFTEPEKARQGYQQVFTIGMVRDYPLTLRRTAGSAMEVLYNATVFKGADGEVEGVFAAARDITDRKRTEEALHRSESRYRSLVTATTQIVWTTNRDGQVVDDMPMWRDYTGMTRQQISGAGWLNSLHPDDRSRTEQVWGRAWRNREPYDTEYRIRNQDGEYRMFSVRGVPVLENDGNTVREWIGTCTDITERRQAEEEIRRLNEELEQRVIQRTAALEAANKELEAFTYSVSHDLRAPLRHISGFSKILAEDFGPTLPPEAQHHVQRIEEGTRRMGTLVDDLLNLARVGRRELSLQVAGLRAVVDEVIVELKSELEGREVEWKISSLPFVECDPGLVKQIFQNLISNAVKFTRPRPKAVIEIGQEERDGVSALYVRDNGVGFSMKYADKLFGVFQRLHRVEDFEGTGVGLATVQRIVQKHHGRIWAEAELDKGAAFFFTLGHSEKTELKTKAVAAGEKTCPIDR